MPLKTHKARSENGETQEVWEVLSWTTVRQMDGPRQIPGLSSWQLPDGRALNLDGKTLRTVAAPHTEFTLED